MWSQLGEGAGSVSPESFLVRLNLSAHNVRYVGAQIGVHDPKGKRVGKVSHLRNRELLFAVAPTIQRAGAAVQAAERAMA